MARRSVERTKKLPWNEDIRRPTKRKQNREIHQFHNQAAQFKRKRSEDPFMNAIWRLTLRCTHTHHGFDHDGHGNDFTKFVREFDCVF